MRTIVIAVLLLGLWHTPASANDKAEEPPGAVKKAVVDSAKNLKNGLVDYGKTVKKTGRKLGKYVTDSARQGKDQIKRDFHRLKEKDGEK
jgi:hypothetical protein